MRNFSSKILLFSFIFSALASCKNNDRFRDEPFLEYRSYRYVYDEDSTSNRKSIEFTLYFTDGDGDLGSDEEPKDTCDISINNFFIRYFEKVDGTYTEVEPRDSCLPFDSRIPSLSPGGSNPTLEGEIITFFDYSGYPFNEDVDSVRFEFKVVDRAGHESNISGSPSIPVPQR
ncbi:MAG: hypothetical protein CMI36_13020 [Owenweeksia sp.]|nr:hypothetical protein [Owenweeksia sp.]MBF99909.1 hypothetical protein [Owenweeksia sp.]HBF20677.1 hypothetical protein [Cryomorphaceae bacterium]HCQ17180.1 hypothetical protein [Cryomorphaceae bacterium]|tara:strand:- start:754 stop:1272 length:519 start_codon:yes stop_codon:yes gene_type:complete